MKAPRKQIAGVIADMSLAGQALTKVQATSLAAYLLETRRTGELDSLLRDVQSAWADQGYVEVIAASAHELSPQVVSDIEAEARRIYPDAKRIVVTPKLDPPVCAAVHLPVVNYRMNPTLPV